VLFSSIAFIFYFLPVFLAVYFASGLRTAALLTGSVLFYSWGEGSFVVVLGSLIATNYWLARRMDKDGSPRRLILAAVLVLNVGTLALFKYYDFIVATLHQLLPALRLEPLGLKLPLGISFFVFQLVSYQMDVYFKRVDPERRLSRFASYILMFPHLIAGPIVRYAEIRGELVSRRWSTSRLDLGAQYFVVGLCQKVLVANIVAPLANHAFELSPGSLEPAVAWLGALAYSLQIYFDFCGYSNMAIGLAFMLGFSFPKNFDYPYSARSVTDFWRRWHMSLSFWFRDYVYIPLGGNRAGRLVTARNLLLVFFLTGLWHGAAWNFIVWGLFHGAFLLLERGRLGDRLRRWPALIGGAYTLLIVMVGWVFFRADTLRHALQYLHAMADLRRFAPVDASVRLLLTPEVMAALVAGLLFAVPTLPALLDRLRRPRHGRIETIEPRLDPVHVHRLPTVLLATGFTLSVALLASSSLNPFLYFRF
jgi:alginate O-acetyltransferase complex protein AlgI